MLNTGQILPLFLLASLMLTSSLAQEVSNTTQTGDSLTVSEQTSNTGSDVDYDALVKELYGDPQVQAQKSTGATREPVETTQGKAQISGPAPGMFPNRIISGMHLSVNGASPFAVATPLSSWYSYIDPGLSIKLAYEIIVENIPLYPLFEISTFNFENSFPEGGSFSGLAYIAQISAIGDNSAAVLGFGSWNGNLGSMMELNYRIRPTLNTFFRLGTRGVLLTNIDPLGEVWWLELRLSMGLEL